METGSAAVADVIFNFVMLKVMTIAREALEDEGLLSTICPTGGPPSEGAEELQATDPTWVDDEVLFVKAGSVEELIDAVRRSVELFRWAVRHYGLEVNFKAGKSEAIMQLRGKG